MVQIDFCDNLSLFLLAKTTRLLYDVGFRSSFCTLLSLLIYSDCERGI